MMRSQPLTRRTELRNTTQLARGTGLRSRDPRTPRQPGLAQRVAVAVSTALVHKPREPRVFLSRSHRQAVAGLDCVCCGRVRHSQAAHLNLLALGKGRGLKCSDAFTIPLCADGPGWRGCHSLLDQGGQARAVATALQLEWLQTTRLVLTVRGMWPAAAEADYQRLVVPYLIRRAA